MATRRAAAGWKGALGRAGGVAVQGGARGGKPAARGGVRCSAPAEESAGVWRWGWMIRKTARLRSPINQYDSPASNQSTLNHHTLTRKQIYTNAYRLLFWRPVTSTIMRSIREGCAGSSLKEAPQRGLSNCVSCRGERPGHKRSLVANVESESYSVESLLGW